MHGSCFKKNGKLSRGKKKYSKIKFLKRKNNN